MGTYSRKLRELIEEFDAMEDEDMLELAKEAYKLGCKEGKRKAMEGYGNRMEEDEDDEDEEEDDEVTPEDLAGMDFEALEDLCDDKELETDPDEFDEEDVEKLRKAVAKELGITLPKAKAASSKDTKKKKK